MALIEAILIFVISFAALYGFYTWLYGSEYWEWKPKKRGRGKRRGKGGGEGVDKPILDVCCGSKMFWFDKSNPDVVFMDNREFEDVLCDGRKLMVKPDIIGDFRNIPFSENTFKLVVFDPPHLIHAGKDSWLAKKYGLLDKEWEKDIEQGFSECIRVLEPYGVLIFKWNEDQIKTAEILRLIKYKPLFGNRRSKTKWLVFMKPGGNSLKPPKKETGSEGNKE